MQAYVVISRFESPEDGFTIEAVVTEPSAGMDADARAYDIAERLSNSDRVIGGGAGPVVEVESVKLNPTNGELGVTLNLAEMRDNDIALAAYLELKRAGFLMVPLWANPAWLVHEVRTRFNIGVDFKGRQMTLVSKDEVKRRREFGVADENAPSDFGQDAGFVETQ